MSHWNVRRVQFADGKRAVSEVYYEDDGTPFATGSPYWRDVVARPHWFIKAMIRPVVVVGWTNN
jgi:hypothetical protein